jgi:hypothetical protein
MKRSYITESAEYNDEYDEEYDIHLAPMIAKKCIPLLNGKVKVTRRQTIVVKLDYPLGATVRFTRTKKGGWTLQQIANEIHRIYQTKIYAGAKVEDEYGVWGHDIGDLVLEGIDVRNVNDYLEVNPSIGS